LKIVTFLRNDALHTGALLAGDRVLDFDHEGAGLPAADGPLDWADMDGAAHQAARRLEGDAGRRADELAATGAIVPISEVTLQAPIPRPGKVICIGLNYRDHAEESGMDIPELPLVFSKFSSCVVGHGDDVVLPKGANEVDYEAEFGVVIGRTARHVKAEDAMDHVLGYCNVNDVSARDFQFADGQWQRGKSCETFCPCGPYLATTDEIADPHELRIQFRLNGTTLQDSSTNQLIFGIPELIAHVSAFVTLEPGDLISTGTPPGVGFARKPPVYVQPGDVMEVEVEGLGVLRNAAVADEG
jgi:2-keto-4-pentenoate hydratase/2-oxohepta-3-ene-1,7-dioic acid hydratase in catechol pathway